MSTTKKHMGVRMNKDWTTIKKITFVIMMISFGALLGINFPINKPTKQYPIEVRCFWSTYGFQSYPTMDADSVKGDTIYKDGLSVVNKNIVNVNFK
jgi:hypothetical protein